MYIYICIIYIHIMYMTICVGEIVGIKLPSVLKESESEYRDGRLSNEMPRRAAACPAKPPCKSS